MTVRRKAVGIAALGFGPLALTLVTAGPAAAHGSMSDPVSRVSTCFAEGPESPQSGACKAAVKASGAQAFYDWNEVNIADAAGKHKDIIPDGKLCSAGREKYKGLDLPREDWPASKMTSGSQEFEFKATAPHKGTFALYITKDGYDPSEPLKWSDLEAKPFAKVKDPELQNGDYLLKGDVPEKSGRHLIYSVWQRSDSPEAFYSCSDVTFGGKGTAAAAPAGTGPETLTEEQISEQADKSTVDHSGHGADHEGHNGSEYQADGTVPNGGTPEKRTKLAETGGEDSSATMAAGGAAVLVVGAGIVLATARRRSRGHRRG